MWAIDSTINDGLPYLTTVDVTHFTSFNPRKWISNPAINDGLPYLRPVHVLDEELPPIPDDEHSKEDKIGKSIKIYYIKKNY